MTLDEAIKHAEEVAEKNEKQASWFWGKEGNPNYENCVKCAEEHRQLAEWLKDYKRLKEQEPCFEWIGDKAYPICPKCNCNIIEEYISCADYAEIYKPMKFCPSCGAKMESMKGESN